MSDAKRSTEPLDSVAGPGPVPPGDEGADGFPPERPSRLEQAFERTLWLSRMLVLIAVIFALLVALVMFVFATFDVTRLISYTAKAPFMTDAELSILRLQVVAKVVKIVDFYLIATFMLIFSMGLYELFIGKIEIASRYDVAKRLLTIHDLDDLKSRLVKIVMLILALLFLENAVLIRPQSELELLYLAIGIVLVSAALFLSQKKL